MRDISIGIYHKDYQYGKRLMEYLNHQKDFPMTASFISDEDAFSDRKKKEILNVWFWQKRQIIMEAHQCVGSELMILWVECTVRAGKK